MAKKKTPVSKKKPQEVVEEVVSTEDSVQEIKVKTVNPESNMFIMTPEKSEKIDAKKKARQGAKRFNEDTVFRPYD